MISSLAVELHERLLVTLPPVHRPGPCPSAQFAERSERFTLQPMIGATTRRNTTRFATSNLTHIAYELRAELLSRRKPWLVLIQGLGFDRYGWDPVVRRLGRHFRLVLVDNRGIGQSDVRPGPTPSVNSPAISSPCSTTPGSSQPMSWA
jgi:pimeloyl-ACP methyl ester carboxylesterase